MLCGSEVLIISLVVSLVRLYSVMVWIVLMWLVILCWCVMWFL